jgi:hypothetical protein
MSSRGAVFEPLSDTELAGVRVSVQGARMAAVDAGEGQEPPQTHIGFVYIGRWSPPPASLGHSTAPPAMPAYVVQVMSEADPAPSASTGFVVVDAATGVALVIFGPCHGPECLSDP